MTNTLFNFPDPFIKSTKKQTINVFFIAKSDFKNWISKQKKYVQTQAEFAGFKATAKQVLIIRDSKGHPEIILSGLSLPTHYLDAAETVQHIQNNLAVDFITKHAFAVTSNHEEDDLTKICIGWGMAAYKFDAYKIDNRPVPSLLWPAKANQQEINASLEATSLLRNLINTPPNDLGTDELADAAKQVAKTHKAKIKIIKDEELIKKNFPMIYEVGKASPRRPQLVDMTWGKKTDPKVTIVGKGVIYDTGGLNLKPGMYMRDMKKDMGGAAHALGTAWMIMALNLPIQLRVLLPIAENSVAGNSYRPGDVLNSRKGLTVEIGDTDAEGRLVVADALTYASEDNPELLIDFCTLTGAARVALGYDIPAFFSNNDVFIDDFRHSSLEHDDPVWPLPLWNGYMGEMDSTIADICNDGKGRAGAIHGGLFLQRFIDNSIDWIHIDCFAWEQSGKAGRPQGGADTGMRAMVNFIRKRYNS
jgi:leucyl aminopeptidase